MNKDFRIQIFKIASLCRNFEEEVITNINNKKTSRLYKKSQITHYVNCLKHWQNEFEWAYQSGHSTFPEFIKAGIWKR